MSVEIYSAEGERNFQSFLIDDYGVNSKSNHVASAIIYMSHSACSVACLVENI